MNPVENVLLSNIDKPNSCFVFPTDIASSRWADHILRIRGGTVAMKKFIAWDVFKQNSIKSKVKNKKSIPPAMRKIFTGRLIRENAKNCEQVKTPVFSSLIQTQWAGQASIFTSWFASILPQLGVWFKQTTGLTIDSILSENADRALSKLEGDDRDMFVLSMRYAQFMEKHAFFEPAWEIPPFNDDGKEYFIFFPESLSDYGEHRELLVASSHVQTITFSDTANLPCDTFFYTNSRREITEVALYIRALAEKSGVSWDSIAVCIPDSQNYEPYVIREFTKRNIPFVKRTSKALGDYPAGGFFRSVIDCVSQDFSFSSLVQLIMNKNLPWKDTSQINELVSFGMNNNCLYSWVEDDNGKKKNVNVWEDAFLQPVGSIDPETRRFFTRLKQRLQSMRSAETFAELRRQYFSFREQFFDMEKCGEETDLVLSRCISELTLLVELEKDYPEDGAVDPFLFFTECLQEKYYLAQQKTSGVAILPYKTAAAAPYDCHIILGAGQNDISVVYTRLDFLPQKKRRELGIFDEDASDCFINMHKFNSVKNSAFFCSEQTFSGFTIPHPKTGAASDPENSFAANPEYKEKFSLDHYMEENTFFSSASNISAPVKLHDNQINGFINWKNRRFGIPASNGKWNTGKIVQEFIRSIYGKNGKYSVSASSLQSYFQCSLKWLFGRVFTLENVQLETSLMHENISGLIYHAVLDKFFTELKNNGETLPEPVYTDSTPALPEVYRKLLERSVDSVFDDFPSLKSGGKPQMSIITTRLVNAGKKDVKFNLEKCLAGFLSFFAGCRVAGSEIFYKTERDSFLLNGIVDCVLEDTSESKYIIIDFKLKKLPLRADCTGEGKDGLVNFQLPMYITLTEENEKFKVYTALFYSILDSYPEVLIGAINDKDTGKTIPKNEDERIIHGGELYNGIFAEFNKKAEQFSREINTGNFTVFESKDANCFECNYQRICRTVYAIGRETVKEYRWN